MEEKLLTLVVLPYSKAQMLKMRLESENIETDLEDINLMEGAATSVKVRIMEKDVQQAVPVLEKFLGKKPAQAEKKKLRRKKTIFWCRLILRRFQKKAAKWPSTLQAT